MIDSYNIKILPTVLDVKTCDAIHRAAKANDTQALHVSLDALLATFEANKVKPE